MKLKKTVKVDRNRIDLLKKAVETKREAISGLKDDIEKDLIEIFKLEYPNFREGAVAEYPVVSSKGEKGIIKGVLSISSEGYTSTAIGYITPYKKDGTLSSNRRIVYEPEKVKVVK